MSTSGFLRTVSPEMHTINLICTFIYKDVQTEQYIFLQSAEIVKILLYLLLSRTIVSQNTQKIGHKQESCIPAYPQFMSFFKTPVMRRDIVDNINLQFDGFGLKRSDKEELRKVFEFA